jgi:hypothetical protein
VHVRTERVGTLQRVREIDVDETERPDPRFAPRLDGTVPRCISVPRDYWSADRVESLLEPPEAQRMLAEHSERIGETRNGLLTDSAALHRLEIFEPHADATKRIEQWVRIREVRNDGLCARCHLRTHLGNIPTTAIRHDLLLEGECPH